MSDFINRFEQERATGLDFDLVAKFNLVRNQYRYNTFIFVEGSTDENFYSSTSEENLSKCAFYLHKIVDKTNLQDEYLGKKAVLYALKCISGDKILSKDLHKCMFIIDRDFEETIDDDLLPETEIAFKQLYKTQGHSVESYLFHKNNIKNVLRYLSPSLNQNDFFDKLDEFVDVMCEYYAANALITGITISNNIVTPFYKHVYQREEILSFDFSKENFWLGKQKAIAETESMRSQIEGRPLAQLAYDYRKEEIRNNSMLLRGHDAFEFLYQYLRQKLNMKFDIFEADSHYKDLVKDLFVEFKPVTSKTDI